MRIVIIEDEPAIRRELTVLLQNALYEVTAFDDFDDVASAALAASPDLILLDVKLPGESGFDICSKIRAVSDVPVLFLTSQTDAADELNGMLKGGDDYITKPFHPPILLARIAAVLNLLGSRAWRVDRMRVLAQKTVFFPYGGSDCTD